jgi:hypothetical protein
MVGQYCPKCTPSVSCQRICNMAWARRSTMRKDSMIKKIKTMGYPSFPHRVFPHERRTLGNTPRSCELRIHSLTHTCVTYAGVCVCVCVSVSLFMDTLIAWVKLQWPFNVALLPPKAPPSFHVHETIRDFERFVLVVSLERYRVPRRPSAFCRVSSLTALPLVVSAYSRLLSLAYLPSR